MKVQSTGTMPQQLSFRNLIIKQGSFDALKQSKYFPTEKFPNYNSDLRNFYKRLMQLKKQADRNPMYNVVVKPEENLSDKRGVIVIENKEGREQEGFKEPFYELLRIRELEPHKYYTENDIPNILNRWYQNMLIKINNKKNEKKQIDLKEYLDIIYKRIESYVRSADYLFDLYKLKERSTNVGKN